MLAIILKISQTIAVNVMRWNKKNVVLKMAVIFQLHRHIHMCILNQTFKNVHYLYYTQKNNATVNILARSPPLPRVAINKKQKQETGKKSSSIIEIFAN